MSLLLKKESKFIVKFALQVEFKEASIVLANESTKPFLVIVRDTTRLLLPTGKTCVGLGRVDEVPSPKFHTYWFWGEYVVFALKLNVSTTVGAPNIESNE